MKTALHQGGTNALNLYHDGWAVPGLGPELPTSSPSRDRRTSTASSSTGSRCPETSSTYAGRYDEGKTATHEAYLFDLEHTFFGGCNAKGDFVDYTPAGAHLRLPGGQGHTPGSGLDPIHNYMDYSYDGCYNEFTPGQVQRMRDAWLYFRAAR